MTPTNAMAPAGPAETVLVVASGIDSIWLNVYGEFSEDQMVLLDWAKEQAQHSPIRKDLAPLPPFLGENLLIEPKGKPRYDYVVGSDDLTVQLKGPGGLPVPPMVIRISSQCLWRLGGGGWSAIEAAVAWAGLVFADGCTVKVSHYHECADLQGWVPSVAELGGVVKRADTLDVHLAEGEGYQEDGIQYRLARGDALQGVSAGRSNRLRMSIYDKTKEIRKSGKEWFRGVWQQNPDYDSSLPVWRVEPQYGRELLHKHNIETLDDLRAHQAALYRYALGWFSWRQRQDSDADHPQRWPLIPAWTALLAARGASAPLPVARVVRPVLVRLAQAQCGYVSTFMALTGETDDRSAQEQMRALVDDRAGPSAWAARLARKRQRYATNGDGERRAAAARAAVLA
jgi:hypothetical protein